MRSIDLGNRLDSPFSDSLDERSVVALVLIGLFDRELTDHICNVGRGEATQKVPTVGVSDKIASSLALRRSII